MASYPCPPLSTPDCCCFCFFLLMVRIEVYLLAWAMSCFVLRFVARVDLKSKWRIFTIAKVCISNWAFISCMHLIWYVYIYNHVLTPDLWNQPSWTCLSINNLRTLFGNDYGKLEAMNCYYYLRLLYRYGFVYLYDMTQYIVHIF